MENPKVESTTGEKIQVDVQIQRDIFQWYSVPFFIAICLAVIPIIYKLLQNHMKGLTKLCTREV